MNQRRVRVLPRSESRRGEYAAKPHLPRLGKTRGLIFKKGAVGNPTIKSVRSIMRFNVIFMPLQGIHNPLYFFRHLC